MMMTNFKININFSQFENFLGGFKDLRIRSDAFTPFAEDLESVLSEERLKQIKANGDLTNARLLEGNDNRYTFKRLGLNSLESDLANQLGVNCRSSGFYWYPYGGYCGWHTNNNAEGERIYLVWAQDEGKSFFRYQNPETEEIVTSWDKAGWQLKRFTISKEKTLWHCVGSKTNRISIGFKILNGQDLQ